MKETSWAVQMYIGGKKINVRFGGPEHRSFQQVFYLFGAPFALIFFHVTIDGW
jgi:hypothetical protein